MKTPKLFQPISGKFIHNYLPDATILKFSELKHYSTLPKLPLVLLYEVQNNLGHWVTVLKTPQGIEHFDSYGYAPDMELNFIPKEFQLESNQNHKYLLKLLYDSHAVINYNPYPLQKGLFTATCGRWVILRNMFNDLTTDQFHNTFVVTSNQFGMSPDELVSFLI